MHKFEQILGMSFVWSEKRTETRSWMSPSPKDEEEVEGDQTQTLHVLDPRRLQHEECGVALKRGIEKSMSSPPNCGM